jgi:hypothetical protein
MQYPPPLLLAVLTHCKLAIGSALFTMTMVHWNVEAQSNGLVLVM